MKKVIIILILLLLTIETTSCNLNNIETSEKISAHRNNTVPLMGKWEIESYKNGNAKGGWEAQAKSMIGEKAIFHSSVAGIGNNLSLEPSYKIKNVNSTDYLLYQYKVSPEYLGISSKKIQIVSIISKEQFFYEFIKINDNEIVVNIDGVFYYLKKLDEDVNTQNVKEYLSEKSQSAKIMNDEGTESPQSGVLIGLKYPEYDDNGSEHWAYKTVWIRSYNKSMIYACRGSNLFVPRKTGFWEVGVNRRTEDNVPFDELYAKPYNKEISKSSSKTKEDYDEKNTTINIIIRKKLEEPAKEKSLKNILAVGNNYISIEKIINGKHLLQVLPIDNIENSNPIKISDIAGETGKNAFLEAASKYSAQNFEHKNNFIGIVPNEESFGLSRRSGHWIMKGRINISENNQDHYGDFNIKTVTPQELITYDELSVPWSGIKLKVPEAVDGYTSPNKDIAVIVVPGNLLVYEIRDGELFGEPLKKVKLKSEEQVVMAEWATEKYVYTWEEEFLKNGGQEINEE